MISSLELARLCNVSQGTVDRALHNRPGISDDTKQKILQVAGEQGYRPHPAARELLHGQSTLVGALMPAFQSVFFLDLMAALQLVLQSQGLRLLLSPVTNRDSFLEGLEDFAARRSRAVLVVPPEENIALPDAVTRDMPVLSFLSACKGKNTSFLSPDEVKTGERAVSYLTRMGHKRILHLTYAREARGIQDRARGYERAMRKRGLKPAIFTDIQAPQFVRKIREKGNTALFCHNDWLALSVIHLLNTQGLRVPEDVSVMGVDNSPTFAALYPGITTMAYPIADLAKNAGRWLKGQSRKLRVKDLSVVKGRTVADIHTNQKLR